MVREELAEIEGQISDIFRALSNGFQKLEKIKDPTRQNRQLEELTDKMCGCKRLIKEFDRELKDTDYKNDPNTNKMNELVNLYPFHTPLLVELTFNMHHLDAICRLGRMCNFDSFLRAVPELERLTLSGYSAKFLSTGRGLKCSRRRVCSKITFGHLKFLRLFKISFTDLNELRVVLQLVLNSPILQVLSVSGMPSSDASLPHGIWDDTISKFPTLNHLKTVELSGLHGLPNEMKFIEFLLSHSTCLQDMNIVLDKSLEGRLDIWNDVLRCRRSSPHASVCINYSTR